MCLLCRTELHLVTLNSAFVPVNQKDEKEDLGMCGAETLVYDHTLTHLPLKAATPLIMP